MGNMTILKAEEGWTVWADHDDGWVVKKCRRPSGDALLRTLIRVLEEQGVAYEVVELEDRWEIEWERERRQTVH